MFPRSQASRWSSASICLDYGADEMDCAPGEFGIRECGMHFKSRWQFDPGMQLAVTLCCRNRAGHLVHVDAEGIVVDCECIASRRWRVTLRFLETPDVMCAAAGDASERAEWGC